MELTAYDTIRPGRSRAVPRPPVVAPALVIEGDFGTARRLRLHLRRGGHASDWAASSLEGLRRARHRRYAFALIGAAAASADGAALCYRLRAARPRLPIIALLPARAGARARAQAYERGADVCLSEPVHARELQACLRALLRRIRAERQAERREDEAGVLRCGDLCVDAGRRRVTIREEGVHLTPKEFGLLALLAARPGRAFSRAELLDAVWGYQYEGYSATVNTHVNRLRKKIEPDPAAPRYVRTVWGVGYRMAELGELGASQNAPRRNNATCRNGRPRGRRPAGLVSR